MTAAVYYDKGNSAHMQQDALALEMAALGKREAALLVVCDGIGGLAEGEYASSYVTMQARNWFYGSYLRHVRRRHGAKRVMRDCVGMLYDCNRYLTRYGKERGIRLGTTMTMVLLREKRLFRGCSLFASSGYLLFHAGDSRAYLTGRGCRVLTTDDCLGDHALHRCLGSFPWRGVQKKRGRLRRGESILLCSDGFWRHLEKMEIAEGFGKRGLFWDAGPGDAQLEKRLEKLGEAGRGRGEKDNQAAVIVCI
ncbi:hypothetical protein D7X98_04350 [bacterium 1XD8-76]|nr:hypothetical protein D7X98_04350 [bacterium 1XD8-76]